MEDMNDEDLIQVIPESVSNLEALGVYPEDKVIWEVFQMEDMKEEEPVKTGGQKIWRGLNKVIAWKGE